MGLHDISAFHDSMSIDLVIVQVEDECSFPVIFRRHSVIATFLVHWQPLLPCSLHLVSTSDLSTLPLGSVPLVAKGFTALPFNSSLIILPPPLAVGIF